MNCHRVACGSTKGHLVRELEGLCVIMGEVISAVGIKFRLINISRRLAVGSRRAQCDKQQYRLKMREVLESQPNLSIKQAEVAELILENSQQPAAISHQEETAPDQRPTTKGQRRVLGIRLRDGRTVGAAAVTITT